jgi:asparagine synthase (glutamine-hydrolysing)
MMAYHGSIADLLSRYARGIRGFDLLIRNPLHVCGIAGVIGRDAGEVRRALAPMLACQTHRGPDDEGTEIVEAGGWTAGLGQRRLSIIDLSPAGHQPMVHPQTGDVLIYNGELYNFQDLRAELAATGVSFRGHSDTEVILHALAQWGPRVVDRLYGMYAFAWLDRRNRKLLLARDPVGIKPLYIAQTADRLLFASEVRGLLASGLMKGEVDPSAVAGLLAFGAVQGPRTILKGATTIKRGALVEFDLSGSTIGEGRVIHRWTFPTPDPTMDEGRAVESLRTTLDTSIRQHLISDVPVGVFLSSGVDSTILASLAARHTERLRTFTVGFADNPDMSEAPLTERTARDLGVEHTEIQVTDDEALETTRSWMRSLDQPSVDGLNVYVISKAVRERGIVVALSGQGGDELFGGYPSFADVPAAARQMRRIAWLPKPVRAGAAALATARQPAAVRFKAVDMARTQGDIRDLYFHRRRMMSDAQLASLGVRAADLGLDACFLPPEAVEPDGEVAGDAVATISRLESRFYMGNMLLRDSDTNGMAHSLEIRVPFLDRRMLDLAFSVPGRVMLPDGRATKHLLRRAFHELLRPELAQQGKRGFTLPVKRWMTGPLRDQSEAAIRHLKHSGLLRAEGIDCVWRAFLAEPESPIWSRALTLTVLGQYVMDRGLR